MAKKKKTRYQDIIDILTRHEIILGELMDALEIDEEFETLPEFNMIIKPNHVNISCFCSQWTAG